MKAAAVIVREDVPETNIWQLILFLKALIYKLQVNQLQSRDLRQFLKQKTTWLYGAKNLGNAEIAAPDSKRQSRSCGVT